MRFSLRPCLLGGTGVIFIVALITVAYGWWGSSSIEKAALQTHNISHPIALRTKLLVDLHEDTHQIFIHMIQYDGEVDSTMKPLDEVKLKFAETIASIQEISSSKEIESISKSYQVYTNTGNQLVQDYLKDGYAAIKGRLKSFNRKSKDLNSAIYSYRNTIIGSFNHDLRSIEKQSTNFRFTFLLAFMIFVLVGAALLFALHRFIKKFEQAHDDLKFKNIKLEDQRQSLKLALDKAEDATKSKNVFLATMSHEIRTPMNGIIGMAQILNDSDIDDTQREYVEIIEESSENLMVILNDILDFSKIEAGKMQIENIPFKIKDTIENVIKLFSFKAEEQGIIIKHTIPTSIHTTAIGDPGRIRQTLTNLIQNALKFTKEGSVIVKVAVVKEDTKSYTIRIEVCDTGIGIPENKIETLFSSFSQVDMSTTRKYGGTGLGLSICKQLVKLMNGTIGVESQLDKGSTFWIEVPFEKSITQASDKSIDVDLSCKKILFIGKNEESQKIYSDHIKSLGGSPEIIINHKQAIDTIISHKKENKPYDIVIINQNSPSIDGFDILKKCNQDSPQDHTKFILLANNGVRGDAAQSQTLGFSAYMSKPITQSMLYETIQKVLSQKHGNHLLTKTPNQDNIITKHSLREEGEKLNILYVEDNKINQLVGSTIIENLGFYCTVANNGKEAIDLFIKNSYHLILMDLQMPEMDGIEAAKEIRKLESKNQHIPILALTADLLPETKIECKKVGMDGFLDKPLIINDLIKEIEVVKK
ncbi:MAG: response regulator [Planctomycetes bacterium]|nr:response regulator [Planctomycetota bacterium]